MKNRTIKIKTINLSFSRERGTLGRSDRSPGSGFNLLAAPSHQIKGRRIRIKDELFFHPFAFLLYPRFRQWLVRAAFVALTVAGQQGNSRKAKDKG